MQQACLILVAMSTLLAAGDTAESVKREREKLQGVWAVTELREGDRKAPDENFRSMRMEFNGETVTITVNKDMPPVKGVYTVDPEKSPPTMDITYKDEDKTVVILAVYELKGDDLKLCHSKGEGGGRPGAVESTPKTILATLKRQK